MKLCISNQSKRRLARRSMTNSEVLQATMTVRCRLITIATVAAAFSVRTAHRHVRPSNPAEVNPAVDRALFAVYKQSLEDADDGRRTAGHGRTG